MLSPRAVSSRASRSELLVLILGHRDRIIQQHLPVLPAVRPILGLRQSDRLIEMMLS